MSLGQVEANCRAREYTKEAFKAAVSHIQQLISDHPGHRRRKGVLSKIHQAFHQDETSEIVARLKLAKHGLDRPSNRHASGADLMLVELLLAVAQVYGVQYPRGWAHEPGELDWAREILKGIGGVLELRFQGAEDQYAGEEARARVARELTARLVSGSWRVEVLPNTRLEFHLGDRRADWLIFRNPIAMNLPFAGIVAGPNGYGTCGDWIARSEVRIAVALCEIQACEEKIRKNKEIVAVEREAIESWSS